MGNPQLKIGRFETRPRRKLAAFLLLVFSLSSCCQRETGVDPQISYNWFWKKIKNWHLTSSRQKYIRETNFSPRFLWPCQDASSYGMHAFGFCNNLTTDQLDGYITSANLTNAKLFTVKQLLKTIVLKLRVCVWQRF